MSGMDDLPPRHERDGLGDMSVHGRGGSRDLSGMDAHGDMSGMDREGVET